MPKILKLSASCLTIHLTKLRYLCISNSTWPAECKLSHVTPVVQKTTPHQYQTTDLSVPSLPYPRFKKKFWLTSLLFVQYQAWTYYTYYTLTVQLPRRINWQLNNNIHIYTILSPDNLSLKCVRFDCLGLFPPQVPGLSKRGALNILNRLNLRVSESLLSEIISASEVL